MYIIKETCTIFKICLLVELPMVALVLTKTVNIKMGPEIVILILQIEQYQAVVALLTAAYLLL